MGCGVKGLDHHIEGMDTLRFLNHEGMCKIQRDRIVTYLRIMVDYCAHKKDPNCVRIAAGGNLVKGLYPTELTTHTSDLTTPKCMWSSVINTPGARYACTDTGTFFTLQHP